MNCAREEHVKSHLTKAEKPLFYVHKYSNVIFFLIVHVLFIRNYGLGSEHYCMYHFR